MVCKQIDETAQVPCRDFGREGARQELLDNMSRILVDADIYAELMSFTGKMEVSPEMDGEASRVSMIGNFPS